MILELRESSTMVEGEGENFSFLMTAQGVLFIEDFRVGEDPVRTGRISACYNSLSWPFDLPVPLLLRSLHPDIQFE